MDGEGASLPAAPRGPNRWFTRQQVLLAWERQGRICNLCHRAIPVDLMEGDHIVPWIDGGRTSMDNLQALCGSCNLRKGRRAQEVAARYFDVESLSAGTGDLRRWQAAALAVALDRLRSEPVLIEACPGAGKTRFGLEVAFHLIESGEISRVLIVVPTVGIADVWQLAASAAEPRLPTIPLRSPRSWRPVDPIGSKWAGAILTYQSLIAATEVFLAHATDPGERTLVIFDEVHHAGADKAWGIAAQTAFAQGAAALLSLTGTPFRTGLDPIVFVPSEGGTATPQFRYSYGEALADGACRPVQFVEAHGTTQFRTADGVGHEVTFGDSLTPSGERSRLRAAIEWLGDGSIADTLLSAANNYILNLRRLGDTDAAALVVCADCDHAEAVARRLHETFLRNRPVLTCSRTYDPNDRGPADALRTFRLSHEPWIVAVNMVSEGVDIPRLRAVVYLTNRMTRLAFQQIVGRVVRRDPRNVDDYGRVFIPADPRLIEFAHELTDVIELLPPPMKIFTEGEAGGLIRVSAEGPSSSTRPESLGSIGEQGGAFNTSGSEASAELIECARRFIARHHLSSDPVNLALAAADNQELRDELLALKSDS